MGLYVQLQTAPPIVLPLQLCAGSLCSPPDTVPARSAAQHYIQLFINGSVQVLKVFPSAL